MKDADAIRQLTKIFNEKDWFPKDEEYAVYDSFCDLFEVLDPAEKELLLELTQRYIWISGNEYEQSIKDILNLIPSEEIEEVRRLYLFPIIKPTDEGKAKSGISLLYDLKAMKPKLNRYRRLEFVPIENFEGLKTVSEVGESEMVCFVDDFVGTGDTLHQCIEEINKRVALEYSKMIIITISCQKETYDELMKRGIRVFAKHIVGKGITDYNEPPDVEEKKRLMRTIEKSIPGASSFSLGWQESEAVITLKRTPDNTFPIFWKKVKRNGKYYNAPFLRE